LLLFSAGCCTATWTFSCPGIGFGSLSTARQSSPVPSSPVAAKIRESLYVHRDFSTKITFHNKLFFDNLTDAIDIVGIQIITVHRVGKVNFIKNSPR